MAEQDRVKMWEARIRAANRLYDKWSERFETESLEDYYLGRQWKGWTEDEACKLYCINLTFATVETNKPTMMFNHPKVKMSPRPGHIATMGSKADLRAKLCEDTVQTFIEDPCVGFMQATSLALHEAHFRFGIIEVGYTADWIDNPNAGQPVLKEEDDTPVLDDNGDPMAQPDRLPENESIYLKRIPAKNYRVSISSANRLCDNDWVAYYEWHYVEDIKANDSYKNTANLKPTGMIQKNLSGMDDYGDPEREKHEGMVKVWKIWDLRSKKRHVIADGHKKFLQENIGFTFLPHSAFKFYEILDSFYPLPPVYNWRSPQDEINETRESQRAHRRRFYRRYTYLKGSVDKTELDKMEHGGDGVTIETNVPSPIVPIQDAPMGADVWAHLDASMKDFMQVTGVGNDQRSVADSETATQANIIDTRNRLRESASRTKVGDWLADISRLMLLTIREKMALPFWIKRNVDMLAVQEEGQQQVQLQAQMEQQAAMTGMPPQELPPGEAMMDVMVTSHLYEQIAGEDIEGIDVDCSIELASLSPVTQETERQSWNQVLALLTNPQVVAILAQSELMLRKTLGLYGIKSETEIREFQKIAQQAMMALQQEQQQQAVADAQKQATKAGVHPKLVEEAGKDASAGPPQVPQPQGVM